MLNKAEKTILLDFLSLYNLDEEDIVYVKRDFDSLFISTEDCFLGELYIAILKDSTFKKLKHGETYLLIDLL